MIALTYRIEETKAGDLAVEFAMDQKARTAKETILANKMGDAFQAVTQEVMRLHASGIEVTKEGIAERAKEIARQHIG